MYYQDYKYIAGGGRGGVGKKNNVK
jgi:hypothetical protein